MVYDLNGRLIYSSVVNAPVLDLTKTGSMPEGVKIVKVHRLP